MGSQTQDTETQHLVPQGFPPFLRITLCNL